MMRIFLFVVSIGMFCGEACAMGFLKQKLYELAEPVGRGLQVGLLTSNGPHSNVAGSVPPTVIHDLGLPVSQAAGASGHNAGSALIEGARSALNNPLTGAVLDMRGEALGRSLVRGASAEVPSLFTLKNIGVAAVSTAVVVAVGYATFEGCKWGHARIKRSYAQRKYTQREKVSIPSSPTVM